MKRGRASLQRGIALLALLAVISLGASWFVVSQFNAESAGVTAVKRMRNAEALNRAKLALIGYVAQLAATSGESNPGRFPCPEHPWYVGNSSKEGIAGPSVGVSDPGVAGVTSDCASIGRLPWRTIGVDKLLDAAGEPLWYVVGPSWRLTESGTELQINSNTSTTNVSVDGQQVVALIIAPGAAIDAQAATGCTARNQARAAPAPSRDTRDYLECFDSSTLQFTTTATSTAYNDQVVRVTVEEIMPVIEAAVAQRIESEIVPVLQNVFTPATLGFSGANPVYPFAAPFANPGSGAGTSSYQGASATYAGLLPFNQTQGCTESASNPRCTTVVTGTSATTGLPALMEFSKSGSDVQTAGGGSIRTQSSCSWQSAVYVCTGEYFQPTISVTATFVISNVAMGLRSLETPKITCTAVDDVGNGIPEQNVACSIGAVLQTNGSVTLTIATSAMPDITASGWGTYANYKFKIQRAAFGDHPLLSTTARVINFNAGIAEIQNGQTVTGLTSGANGTAIVLKQSGSWGTDAAGLLFFSSVTDGSFQSGESLQVGGATKATAASAQRDFGWFARNEWYRVLYYAVAPGHTAATLPPTCTTAANCLSVTNVTPAGAQRAILLLSGRSVNGSTRPSATLANYLESGNATGAYTRSTINASSVTPIAQRFNDRVVVIGSN